MREIVINEVTYTIVNDIGCEIEKEDKTNCIIEKIDTANSIVKINNKEED